MTRGELTKSHEPSRLGGSLGKPDIQSFQAGLRLSKEKSSDPIRDWDQLEGRGGWRDYASQGKWDEVLEQIEDVLKKNPPEKWSSSLGRHTLAFHGLQAAGFAGVSRDRVENLAQASVTNLPGGWDDYAKMTRDFILGDREGFDHCVRQMNEPPIRVISSMIRNFGTKNYREMYMEVVQEMQKTSPE